MGTATSVEVGDFKLTYERLAYTPEEAAELIGVSRKTIYRLIKRGELRVKRISGGPRAAIRIPREAIVAYLGVSPSGARCVRYGCERPPVKRMTIEQADGATDTIVCAVHWALDYEGRIGTHVTVNDLSTTQPDTQEVST